MAKRKKSRERRGFGAVGPDVRKGGVIVPERKRARFESAASPIKPKKKKRKPERERRETGPGKKRARKKEEDFEFPEMEIKSKRRKVSKIPVGGRQPPTITIGKTFFTKEELAERRRKK